MAAGIRDVFITAAGAHLPGDPISNDEMETYLGLVNGQKSRYREKVLKSNGIEKRYYALTKEGKPTMLNQDLCALAVQEALRRRGMTMNDVGMLAVGTTTPDLLVPGFGSMVHGVLGGKSVEVLSTQGVCATSMTAMKAAVASVRLGEHDVAIAGASEIPSRMMKGSRFTEELELAKTRQVENDSFQYFNADFLRWMLSDGAGAVVLEPKPRDDSLSLRVEWITVSSYAHELETCMYLGTANPAKPTPENTLACMPTFSEAEEAGLFVLRQNVNTLAFGLSQALREETKKVFTAKALDSSTVDHFLPHVSSFFFYDMFVEGLAEMGYPIPKDRWFTNLKYKGNTAAASIYIMLEEGLNEGRFKPGDRILTMVPESGRFMFSYALFTCVGPKG